MGTSTDQNTMNADSSGPATLEEYMASLNDM